MKASAMCAVNFWQLMVNPSAETTSEVQTASIFGPTPKNIQRSVTRSANPSVWSVCMCVKKTAFNCSGDMLSSASRITVPSRCTGLVTVGGAPSYVELLTCLEIDKQATEL